MNRKRRPVGAAFMPPAIAVCNKPAGKLSVSKHPESVARATGDGRPYRTGVTSSPVLSRNRYHTNKLKPVCLLNRQIPANSYSSVAQIAQTAPCCFVFFYHAIIFKKQSDQMPCNIKLYDYLSGVCVLHCVCQALA